MDVMPRIYVIIVAVMAMLAFSGCITPPPQNAILLPKGTVSQEKGIAGNSVDVQKEKSTGNDEAGKKIVETKEGGEGTAGTMKGGEGTVESQNTGESDSGAPGKNNVDVGKENVNGEQENAGDVDNNEELEAEEMSIPKVWKPDLVISKIEFSDDCPKIGDEITVYFNTTNIGYVESKISSSLLESPTCNDIYPQMHFQIPEMAGGGTTEVSPYLYTVCKPVDENKFTITADEYDTNDEIREDNNVGTKILKVYGITCGDIGDEKPDLEVSIEAADNELFVGQKTSISVATVNSGDGKAGESSTSVMAGNNMLADLEVPELEAGKQDTQAVEFTCESKGTYTIVANADWKGNVGESDEGNNKAEVSIECKEEEKTMSDLAITAIRFSNECPDVGDTITVTLVTANLGDVDSYVSHSRIQKPNCNSMNTMQNFEIPELSPGQEWESTLEYKVCAPIDQTNLFSAMADEYDTNKDEPNTENNFMTRTLAISPNC